MEQTRIEDTRSSQYLEGLSPDFTIVKQPLALSILAAAASVQLQVGELDDGHLGKAIKYIRMHMARSMERTYFMTLLDSPDTVANLRGPTRAGRYRRQGIAHRTQNSCTPEQLGLQLPHVSVNGVQFLPTAWLGNGSGVRVYAGHLASVADSSRASPGSVQVCKLFVEPHQRRQALQREVTALQMLRNREPACKTLPQLLDYDAETGVIITAPAVSIMTAGKSQADAGLTQPLVEELFGALEVLQELKHVHCDIEPRHIGTYGGGTAALIDLSLCRPEGETLKAGVTYAGTFFYAANDILERLLENELVEPRFHHDVVALVKSLWALSHLSKFNACVAAVDTARAIVSRDCAAGIRMTREFWLTKCTGGTWRKAIDAAANSESLHHVRDLVVATL
ncbi:hypothetical protein JKP88DRAFT_247924 [Tribonema minus]|uniref:Protein kinase domain-containing protein n=1 Tax=Tribonema minus TaxID=303371 RepID=A0A836CBC0_9STRA|nr:hypothetical protein JKP88DRAFT_247924 [Tribonema minus]